MRRLLLPLLLLTFSHALGQTPTPTPAPRNYPAFVEGDYVIKNFQFRSGETLPELNMQRALPEIVLQPENEPLL